ncbi:MAG: hypothetical protein HY961_11990 [Ignavibacteriae bacterium]|nr:hypothetical protein [Ignavibacteriota bacterium]
MKKHILLFLTLIAVGCKDDGTTPEIPQRVTLTLIDAAVKETYLHIAASNPASNEALALLRNGTTVMTFAAVADTNIADTALTQTTTYQYSATLQTTSATTGKSNAISAQTLAPTSHDWHFTTDSLGEVSSTLYDVAIVNDTLAYAVGEMYLRDLTGQVDPILYNLAIWNGSQWRIQRVPVPLCPNSTGFFPLRTIFAFAWNDIWLSGGGEMIHWDGLTFRGDCSMNPLIQGAITKIWGTSSAGLYAVGGGGTIIHYNGSTWQRVESGTTVNLLDVWGAPDGSMVWACGWEDFQPTVLLRGSGSTWEKRYEDPYPFVLRRDSLSGIISSVWTPASNRVFAATYFGVYSCAADTRGYGKRSTFGNPYLPGFPFRIRGSGVNDYSIIGDYGMVAHFNGVTWKYFAELYRDNIHLNSVSQRANLVIAVGELYHPIYSRGLVIRGSR